LEQGPDFLTRSLRELDWRSGESRGRKLSDENRHPWGRGSKRQMQPPPQVGSYEFQGSHIVLILSCGLPAGFKAISRSPAVRRGETGCYYN
jgi:hypothetical protein